jgi:hypothetical protein
MRVGMRHEDVTPRSRRFIEDTEKRRRTVARSAAQKREARRKGRFLEDWSAVRCLSVIQLAIDSHRVETSGLERTPNDKR